MAHIPVLLNETIKILAPEKGMAFIDATANGGGHSAEILKKMASRAILLAVDRDEKAIIRLKQRFVGDNRLKPIRGNFRNLKKLTENFSGHFDGIVFDLGVSSDQLDSPTIGSGRGFSFKTNEPLLMTYEEKPPEDQLTAAVIVNGWTEDKLAEIFREYGEERYARQIAKEIVRSRRQKKIMTGFELAEVVLRAIPKSGKSKIHPATRVFQALRIAVNDELAALKAGLNEAFKILAPGGRMAVISFHSLEDRIVKNFFKDKKSDGLAVILTKKPIRPADDEINNNPRSRSAKLRAIIKIKND